MIFNVKKITVFYGILFKLHFFLEGEKQIIPGKNGEAPFPCRKY